MTIKRIKGTGAADVDNMRQKIAFSDADRSKWERVYWAIRRGERTVSTTKSHASNT